MLLAYIDESGTNQGLQNGFYIDGPFIIWSAVLVPEEKYFHLERVFCELIRNILNVKNWNTVELHATDIWSQTRQFSSLSEARKKKYFEELFQLLAKMSLPITFSLQQKNPRLRSPKSKRKEIENSIYAFLHGLEHKLAKLNETSVLIADDQTKNQQGYTDMDLLLLDRVKWRNNPGARRTSLRRSKYLFESLSCFLIDQIHYTDSRKSLFIQIADHISFVLQRVFTYLYLRNFPRQGINADIDRVPLSSATFNFFVLSSETSITNFRRDINDVDITILDNLSVLGGSDFLNIRMSNYAPFKF